MTIQASHAASVRAATAASDHLSVLRKLMRPIFSSTVILIAMRMNGAPKRKMPMGKTT